MSDIPAFELVATPESVSRWQIGRDGRIGPVPRSGTALPLSYLVFLRVQPILGVSIHRLLERDPDRGLFGGVTYRAARVPRVGERFSASGSVTGRKQVSSPRGELTITTLVSSYRDAGSVVVEESVRMVDIPAGPPSPPAPAARRAPRHPKLADIAPITRTQIAWLTVETGDANALHFDPAYAASRLYPDVVVPGTLLAAVIEREAARVLGAPLLELDLRLLAPTYPNEPLALHSSRGAQGLHFELLSGDQVRAEGLARCEGGRP
jgi:hydroxyacyl-ACP dehydratase HTD2-like protein with hotdog domain